MKMMVALSLLMTIAGCSNNNGVTAFVPRPATTTTTTTTTTASSPLPSLAATDRHPRRRHVAVASVRRGSYDDDDDVVVASIAGGTTDRRVALARLLATSASLVALPADADAATTTEFSESPTSDASIARSKYDGKDIVPSPPPPAAAADPPAEPKPSADLDGNMAGSSAGAADVGTKAVVNEGAAIVAKSSSPASPGGGKLDPKVSIPVSSEQLLGGAVVFFGLMALANGNDGEELEADGAAATTTTSPPPPSPPADPYGLVGGRNFWDGVDVNAARSAGLVVEAPPAPSPPPPAPTAAAAAVVAGPAADGGKPKWKLEKPVPYGIQNPNGRNPFITEVLEYCEGGKVTEECADSIKGYLDNLADTGAAATTEDVTAIVGYLDSLGTDDATTAGKGRRAGAAFATYLDALSAGSAPPPSSARAVKTYLDTLNGTAGAARSARGGGASGPALPAGTVKLAPDFARYDDRLTSIEGRVATLETKVDELPDRVFEKIEAWQTRQEGRLTEEVRKIVNTLTSALPAARVESSPPPAPAAPPTPAPVPPAAAAVVPASPLAGAIPERPGVPRAGAAAPGPRKGYRFGGGSPWKSDDKPKAAVSPIPEPAAAPVVQHTPLAGAIPERNALPRAGASAPNLRSSVPKRFAVGGGGGAGWKTGKPKGGGGYLDNMSP
ncbi:hypothetical protein ACHAW5_001337 [Stephanodiscus triporus]|uniref:Diatom pyrenoid component 2 domain-containing protein n=1 Tax=Stephanodiscus triporus TaxID=2934178 RepID=A0ABD3NNZ3_9STRA